MSWGMAAVAGATLVGGVMASDAAGDAADQQEGATKNAIGESARQFNISRQDQLPFLTTGQAANVKLRQLLGFGGVAGVNENDPRVRQIYDSLIAKDDAAHQARYGISIYNENSGINKDPQAQARYMDAAKQQFISQYGDEAQASPGYGSLLKPFTPQDLENEPGYQFGLNEGNKAVENAARARGTYMSPMTVKGLLRYGQDYAGTKYGDAFNRDMTNRTTQFNMLSGASGGGQVAANTMTAAGGQYANSVGGLMTSGANARGAAGIASANAYGNAFGAIGNNYMQNSYLNRILGAGKGGSAGYSASPYGGSPYGSNSSDFGYYP